MDNESLKMKYLSFCCGFLFASVCGASVFDDAQFLLQGDADVNNDGVIAQDEAKNAIGRNLEGVLELDVCGSPDGVNNGISCPTVEIDLPRRGKTVSGKVVRLKTLTSKSEVDGIDTVWASGFYKNTDFPLSTEMTAVMRFRWEGFVLKSDGEKFSEERATLINYGYSWTLNEDGMLLSIVPKDGQAVLRVENNPFWWESDLVVKPDTWYDFAITARKGEVRMYLLETAAADAPMSMQKRSSFNSVFNDTFASTHLAVGMFVKDPAYNQFYPLDSWDWRKTDNAEYCFNGYLHQFALWNRVLSDDEIEEAFIGSVSDLQAGVENGSNAEFSGSSSVAFGANSGWHGVKGSLVNKGETMDFVIRNEPGMALSRVVSCSSCVGSSASVSLVVNGAVVGTAKRFNGARRAIWLLPRESLVEGDNTVSLRMVSDGTFLLDAMQITGGFKMVGANSPDADVKVHLLDCNTYNFNRNLTSWKGIASSNRVFRFTLPQSYPTRYGQLWTITCNEWAGPCAGPCDVWANGQCVYSYNGKARLPQVFSFTIPAENLVGGQNTVILRNLAEPATVDELDGAYVLEEITVEPYDPRPDALIMIVR